MKKQDIAIEVAPAGTRPDGPSRRTFLKQSVAGLAALGLAGRFADSAQAGQTRPNILWLVSEDHRPMYGAYGDPLAHTPSIDALARKGVIYRNAFSAAPVCAPSRFAILTGMHAESNAPANHMRAEASLPQIIGTWPQYLRKAGYYCVNANKTDFNCTVDPAAIFDDVGSRAHWKNRPKGQPFMAMFNSMTTHESKLLRSVSGLVKPAAVQLPAYLPDTPELREDLANYYNAIAKMDAEVGEWLRELEEEGVADDTIVFYFSDNGGAMPRGKRYCTDEGLRCELVVYVPPKWAHLSPDRMGTEVHAPVSFVDLSPTVLSIAGIATPPQMQGRAFLGGHLAPVRRYVFAGRNRIAERYDFVRAVSDGRFHYVRNYSPHRPMGQHGAFEWLTGGYQSLEREYLAGRLNEAQARFFAGPRAFEELYDLLQDPDQLHNLAALPEHAARLLEMRGALDEHMLAINDNGFIPEWMTIEGYLPSRDPAAYPLPRLMQLGQLAAQREDTNLQVLLNHLDDANPLIRHWALQGLLMLGKASLPGRERLLLQMRGDALVQNRVVAAEAVALSMPTPEAVEVLAGIIDSESSPWQVQLQSLNALTFIGEQAKAALPAIKRMAGSDQEYLRSAGRYLEAVLEGRYEPSYPVYQFWRLLWKKWVG
ncbi:sulfatase [Pseudomonas sp. BN417]|uniref:sulfatase-like hydrolase/transferase n=1 Tax=Pseudomonas sp. BN417 TaxID=2567890 RepID=UPI00245421A8|nr:sulfatase-like hydrolase/transferase [Pseudomonas sp. BN417]MDH4559141.1 sulfatase [Pseudomonas sp. BN417]